ncbi:YggT family protein [Desertibaculum subflavum]|uniref:YggT family protein n=1 Tax=Desertibaculum subflavum TaxID=2268458 RepID=UPI000E66649B
MARIIGNLLIEVLSIYSYLVLASVIFSWLMAFNVVNTQNRIIYAIWDFLNRITEPALRPIRRILPNLGPVDISPLVLLLGIQLLLIPVVGYIFFGY